MCRSKTVRVVLLCCVLVACWQPAGSIRSVAPVFEGVALSRSTCTQHRLLVEVELDGTRGKFIVDSGAYVNVVFERFAKLARLDLEDNHDRVGGGHGVRVLKVNPKSFAVPGIPNLATPSFVMLEHAASPLAREGCGIAGLISPATLVTDTTALLVDFAAARMKRVPLGEVEAHLSAVVGRRFTARIEHHEYTPGVLVELGTPTLRMMIDTGACCTWAATTSAAGRALHPQSTVGGRIARLQGTTTSRIARTPIRFGTVDRTVDVRLLAPDAGDSNEAGALGADALATCVVAIGESEMRGVCR